MYIRVPIIPCGNNCTLIKSRHDNIILFEKTVAAPISDDTAQIVLQVINEHIILLFMAH